VLDEPTGGLDTPLADRLISDVLAAAGERSVFLITHRASEASSCDTTVVLEAGSVVV
jgi:ATP-binding cassette, subfamily C, bacterial CydC